MSEVQAASVTGLTAGVSTSMTDSGRGAKIGNGARACTLPSATWMTTNSTTTTGTVTAVAISAARRNAAGGGAVAVGELSSPASGTA